MMYGYRSIMYGFVTSLSLCSVAAYAQTADQKSQKIAPANNHISAASLVPGVARHPAGVEIKESPTYHAPLTSNNDATLNLDNRRLSDSGPDGTKALTAKQDIIAPPVLPPLTMYDLNARMQTARASYAGASLAYKQATREGDQARMAAEQQQMATSQSQITQLGAQITACQAQQTPAPVASQKKKHKLRK